MVQFADLAKAFITYREFFGLTYKEEDLISLLKVVPARACLCVISQLTAFPERGDSPELRQGFLEYLRNSASKRGYAHLIKTFEAKLDDRVLYSSQGLMATAKWILAYGNFEREELLDPPHAILAVIYLCMIVSDYLGQVPKEDLPYDLVRNAQFNSQGDLAAEFIRALYICTEIATDKSLYDPDKFVDFNEDFKIYYGYSIWEFASVIFGLYAFFANESRMINTNCFVKLQNLFDKTSLKDVANRITADMTFPIADARKWALDTLKNDWDYTLLWQKPFLTIDGDAALPIAYKTIFGNFFVALKIKIEKCYSDADKEKFQTFFGKPFEQYIFRLLSRSVEECTAANLTPEFDYTGKKSPDALLQFGKRKMLAFEAKAMYMRKKSIFYSEIAPIKKEVTRLIIDPLSQLHDRLLELLPVNAWINLTNVKDVYMFTVSISGIPTNPPIEREIADRLRSKFSIPSIKGYYYLSIEDFELLCSLIEKPTKGRSIFNVLNNGMKSGLTFRNYILTTYKIGRPRLIDDKHKEIFDRIIATVDIEK